MTTALMRRLLLRTESSRLLYRKLFAPAPTMTLKRLLSSDHQRHRHHHDAEDHHANAENHHASLIDVSSLAESMRQNVRSYTQSLLSLPDNNNNINNTDKKVKMAGILAEAGPYRSDAEIYSRRIAETFAQDGIDYELVRCKGESPSNVEDVIRELNARSNVHGILVFYPIFKERSSSDFLQKKTTYLNEATGVYYKTPDDYLRDVVSATKDVEGLCHDYNARWLFRARGMHRTLNQAYIPCTAVAVLKILETYHHNPHSLENKQQQQQQQQTSKLLWSGLQVTVVNRSEILGRPLAAMLALQGATVYSVDDNSTLCFMNGGRMRRCSNLTLEDCLRQSSVVVTGVPSPDFVLPSECIAPGATVVNVSEFSNFDETLLARPNVKLIPHVGKVTCAALEQNLIQLHRNAVLLDNNKVR